MFKLVLEKDPNRPGSEKRKALGPFQWVRVEHEFVYGDGKPVLQLRWVRDEQVWLDNESWAWTAFQMVNA